MTDYVPAEESGPWRLDGDNTQMISAEFFAKPETVGYLRQIARGTSTEPQTICPPDNVDPSRYGAAFLNPSPSGEVATFLPIFSRFDPQRGCSYGRRAVDGLNIHARQFMVSLYDKFHGLREMPLFPAENAATAKLISDAFANGWNTRLGMRHRPYYGRGHDNIWMRENHVVRIPYPFDRNGDTRNPADNPRNNFLSSCAITCTRFNAQKNFLEPCSCNTNGALPFWSCHWQPPNGRLRQEQEAIIRTHKHSLAQAPAANGRPRHLILNAGYLEDLEPQDARDRLGTLLDDGGADGILIEVFFFNYQANTSSYGFHPQQQWLNRILAMDFVGNELRRKVVAINALPLPDWCANLPGFEGVSSCVHPALTGYASFLLGAGPGSLWIPQAAENSGHLVMMPVNEMALGKPIGRLSVGTFVGPQGINCRVGTRQFEHAQVIVNFGSALSTNARIARGIAPYTLAGDSCALTLASAGQYDARTAHIGPTSGQVKLRPGEGTVLFDADIAFPFMAGLNRPLASEVRSGFGLSNAEEHDLLWASAGYCSYAAPWVRSVTSASGSIYELTDAVESTQWSAP
jgi:hypothetical protein